MPLIDDVLPRAPFRHAERVLVAAPTDVAYAAARAVDLEQLPVMKAMLTARSLPERLLGLGGERAGRRRRSSTIDRLPELHHGMMIVGEQPGQELVIGAIGRFWLARVEPGLVAPESFTGFDAPGFGKLAWSVRVDPGALDGSWVSFELRGDGTDAGSRQQLGRTWGVIRRIVQTIGNSIIRRLGRELGEIVHNARALPGDDVIALPDYESTHTQVIEATPSRVWPWLVQTAYGRGWHALAPAPAPMLLRSGQPGDSPAASVGDLVPVGPARTQDFAVLRVAPERLMVVGSPSLLGEPAETMADRRPWTTSWTFLLEPIDGVATHMIARVRGEQKVQAGMAPSVLRAVHELAVHDLVERMRLRIVRKRAEADAIDD